MALTAPSKGSPWTAAAKKTVRPRPPATTHAKRHGSVRPRPMSSNRSPASPATWGRSREARHERDGRQNEQRRRDRGSGERQDDPPVGTQVAQLQGEGRERAHRGEPGDQRDAGAALDHGQLRARKHAFASSQRAEKTERAGDEGDLRGDDHDGEHELREERPSVRCGLTRERGSDERQRVDDPSDSERGECADRRAAGGSGSELGGELVRQLGRCAEARRSPRRRCADDPRTR